MHSNSKTRILYVDDEADNLLAFKAVFRRLYNVSIAESADIAMQILKEQTFDIIITDQRMPKTTGVMFLEKAQKLYPDSIRMILTGYSDVQDIIDAINKGKIYYYINKPWKMEELRVIIDNAAETHRLRQKNKYLEVEKQSLLLQTAQQEKANILSQYEALRNQINPHFLFNSLNILSSLIKSSPSKAIDFSNKFSKIYRKLLEIQDQPTISLNKEFDFIESYLFLQKSRFDGSLNTKIEVSELLLRKNVAPFSVQLLVENAIKHNFFSEEKPLFIHIFTENDFLVVKNNLQERNNVYSTKVGLKNLIARYQLLTDKRIIFEINSDYYIVKIPLL